MTPAPLAAGRVFTARYRLSLAILPLASIGLGVLLAFLAAGLHMAEALTGAGLILFGAFLLVRRAWARASVERPALTLSDSGVEIDGVPELLWSLVAQVEMRGVGPRAMLAIRLKRPLARARLTALWRPENERTLLLRLWLLEDNPHEIEAAFRYFIDHAAP